jgi:drug/metabolite transporter (DMT)-like permease
MPWLILVSLLWAPSPGLIRHHLGPIDASLLAFVRVTLALLVLAPFFRPRGLATREMAALAGIGAVQFGLMYVCYIQALKLLESYLVGVLTIVTPLLVCIVDDLWSRRLRGGPWVAAGLAAIGAGVIVWTKPLGAAAWGGLALVQASNLCFAFGQVAYRRWRRARPAGRDRDVFASLYLGAVLVTLPFAWPALPELTTFTAEQWGVLVFLGGVASGLGFFLWNHGAARTSAGVLAVLNNLKIPLMVACSLLVFGEQTNIARLLLGGGLILAATVFADWIARRPTTAE